MDAKLHTVSFEKGLNKDISPNEYLNSCYFDAKNLRIVVDNSEGMTNTALTTPKGNLLSIILPPTTYILGYTVLRDTLVILAKRFVFTDPKPDKIYKIPLSDIIPYSTAYNVTNIRYPTGNLVYEADLGFDLDHPIRVVGNYENGDVQKIYWVDGINTMKHLNITHNEAYNDLLNLDPNLLELVPNNTYGTYELEETTGGHLRAGRIQYSYQLYSISGVETMFAPPSNLYNITSSVVSDGRSFTGSDIETEVNKSMRVTINLPKDTSQKFNRIRLVALTYEEYNDVPVVRIVAEQGLASDTIVFNDFGNAIGVMVLEEFQVIKNDLMPATIESKDNYLFAANIKEQFFDIDELIKELKDDDTAFLDTRTYRWRYGGSGESGTLSSVLSNIDDPQASSGPVGHPVGIRCYEPVYLYSSGDTSWEMSFQIGIEDYAYNVMGAVSFGGVTGLVSNEVEIALWDYISWDQRTILYVDGFEYNSHNNNTTGMLRIWGSYFMGVPPSTFPFIDDRAIISILLSFTYNTIPAVPAFSECILNKGFGGKEVVLDSGAGPDFSIVSEKDDCINTYNDISNDEKEGHGYKYKYRPGPLVPPEKKDLGGTGPYVSYEFITEDISIGTVDHYSFGPSGNSTTIDVLHSNSSYPGYKDFQNIFKYTGYQRGEVYRFGIVFYDLKGRPSFTKWIGDIRFPEMAEELEPGNTYAYFDIAYGVFNLSTAKSLGIKFIIDWQKIDFDFNGLLKNLSGFQIVRMPRSSLDSTIKAQGVIVPTHKPNTVTGELKEAYYSTYEIASALDYENEVINELPSISPSPPNSTMSKVLVEFISPEIAVNKELIIDKNKDFLEIVGRLNNVARSGSSILFSNRRYDISNVFSTDVAPYISSPTIKHDHFRRKINDALISQPERRDGTIHTIGDTQYIARGYDGENPNNGDPEMAYKGTSLIARIESAFTNTNMSTVWGTVSGQGGSQAMYGRYRKYLGYSQYGGATYVERSYNSYIKAGDFAEISDMPSIEEYEVFNGDVYINIFNFFKLFTDEDAEYKDHTGQVTLSFPVESRINTEYFSTNTADVISNSSNSEGKYFPAERMTSGVSNYPNGYPNIGDLYRYNSAYSAQNISKQYPDKPFDFRSVLDKDVLVTSSERKINGEYADSWLKFKYNNYLELEGDHGAITRLININDRLLAFQSRGIAVLSVHERELVETNNTTTLAVGTGGILSRSDYISKDIGTSLYDAICPTENGVYFYSNYLHAIYRIMEGIEPLSDPRGLKSYFESTPWTDCITVYDRANREILFTGRRGTETYDTLVYSGYTDTFTSFYTLGDVLRYVSFDKYLMSTLDGRNIYQHNIGEYNSYYGRYQKSDLSLIVNPAKTNVVTFHIIEWITDLTWGSTGVEIPNHTFDEMKITNTYQDTGVFDLSNTRSLKKRFRKWRINNFRGREKDRIRDSWMKVDLSWNQTYLPKKLVIHPINFIYAPTKLW